MQQWLVDRFEEEEIESAAQSAIFHRAVRASGDRKDQCVSAGCIGPEVRARFEAIFYGHLQVEQYHARLHLGTERCGFLAVGGFTSHPPGSLHDAAEGIAKDRVVIHDHGHAQGAVAQGGGSSQRKRDSKRHETIVVESAGTRRLYTTRSRVASRA